MPKPLSDILIFGAPWSVPTALSTAESNSAAAALESKPLAARKAALSPHWNISSS